MVGRRPVALLVISNPSESQDLAPTQFNNVAGDQESDETPNSSNCCGVNDENK
jgi:hypothetical protein